VDKIAGSDGGGKPVTFLVSFAEAWVGVLFHGQFWWTADWIE
jgi:hypothetical protein